ncbi:helix-turn-helix domain-containing protein [Nocardia speluncae]|uniref:helix-turn-helix domain-containing protein n=1 Tax=Nocardia speluncae TaxID=419477 RepID=UPI000B0F80AC|nr:helix-turn-helix transcriptional regulator [Nocardia speluncae]
MDSTQKIGEFLVSRRARLRPEDVGIPFFGTRRRVPGLRREELAQLAGVSADYYARLEQGRLDNVSPAVLDAVANALRLSADERTHLFNLARPPRPGRPADSDGGRPVLRPALHALLDAMTHVPAYIVGHRTDILGWNRAAELLFGIDFAELPPERRNWTHLLFLDPDIRALFADDQPVIARQVASDLRMRHSHRPNDQALRELIGHMRHASTQFDELWASHDVTEVAYGTYHFRHPRLGAIEVDYEFMPLVADSGVRALVTYTAPPDSVTAQTLRALLVSDEG